jgi:protein-S-isoprenylcysteine O-methyltransferase Ste14
MYLGMMSILLGVAIFLGSLISFAFPIIFIIIMEKLFIPLEEKNLEKKFGNQYIDYKKRVRRWI